MSRNKDSALHKKFFAYRKENPLELSPQQLEKIELDILKPRTGIVSDEYVEFILWTKGFKSRQEYFSNCVDLLFPLSRSGKLLEVGCGRTARLSRLLAQKGYQMTAIDPQIIPHYIQNTGINCIQDAFVHGQIDLSPYDGVIAQEPCEATEHIIRACVARKKPYFISLCGVPHRLINGEMPEDVFAWYDYLQEIGSPNCVLVNLEIVPGYKSYVIMGFFSA